MERPGVCILGMHRSGTSCLAGSLQLAGLQLGQVVESAPHNRKGNREHLAIRAINDAVLDTSGGAWHSPPETIRWTRDQADQRDEIVEHLASLPGHAWGFKDPRSLLTLPFWHEGIRGLRAVATFRHPMAVAQSLAARDGLPIDAGLRLWRAYNEKLLALLDQGGCPLVSFDVAQDEYLDAVDHVIRRLGLWAPRMAPAQGPPFFEEHLRHQHAEPAIRHHRLSTEIECLHHRLENHYRRSGR